MIWGKNFGGRKRHALVDTQGNLLAVKVTGAEASDQEGGHPLLEPLKERLPRLELIWGDSHYGGSFCLWAKVTLGWDIQTIKSLTVPKRGLLVPEGEEVDWDKLFPKGFRPQPKPLVEGTLTSVKQARRSRVRSARRTAQALHRQLRRQGEQKEEQQRRLYQKLISTAEHMVRQAEQVGTCLKVQPEGQAQRLLVSTQRVLPLIEQVMTQAHVRVLEGKKVAAPEKVLSLHEPHTRAIPHHKGGAQVEFGRHVVFDKVEGGIVTRFDTNSRSVIEYKVLHVG